VISSVRYDMCACVPPGCEGELTMRVLPHWPPCIPPPPPKWLRHPHNRCNGPIPGWSHSSTDVKTHPRRSPGGNPRRRGPCSRRRVWASPRRRRVQPRRPCAVPREAVVGSSGPMGKPCMAQLDGPRWSVPSSAGGRYWARRHIVPEPVISHAQAAELQVLRHRYACRAAS
jgi:hypothetical protein